VKETTSIQAYHLLIVFEKSKVGAKLERENSLSRINPVGANAHQSKEVFLIVTWCKRLTCGPEGGVWKGR